MREIHTKKNLADLSEFAAEMFVRIANNAINERRHFSVALAGGSTPKTLYKLLASGKFRESVEWKKVFFFFGDERNVPPDDPESNFRMANETLLEPLKIPQPNVFRWKTELGTPDEVASDYEITIAGVFSMVNHGIHRNHGTNPKPEIRNPKSKNLPAYAGGSDLFDLVLLGMGADGHTASLFPHTAALKETGRVAVANWVPKLDAFRFTLTFPVINNARNIIALVSGAEKAKTLAEVLEGKKRPDDMPSQLVDPIVGNLWWLVDKAAAKHLSTQ